MNHEKLDLDYLSSELNIVLNLLHMATTIECSPFRNLTDTMESYTSLTLACTRIVHSLKDDIDVLNMRENLN